MRRIDASDRLTAHAVESIGLAREGRDPFRYLELRQFFPPELYAAMVEAMPAASAYRAMSGRAREARRADGTPTRTKIHLLPEFIRHLPPRQREVWGPVGRVLCSMAVRDAFVHRLAPGLEQRFGGRYAEVGMYPIPMLTRDVAGYRIGIHSDTRHKGITVQIFLPRDESIRHAGTSFHRRVGDKRFEKAAQMPFLPNTGYAFAVGSDTWHSLDVLGPEISTRDSILLTYFVDRTPWQMLSNRAKRFGNLAAGELRRLVTGGSG